MSLVTGPDAVYLSLLDTLGASLQKQTLDLITANGREAFNFAAAAPNVARILQTFYTANGRMPAVVFNDGSPARFMADLKARPDFDKPLSWVTAQSGDNVSALPVMNVRVYAVGGLDYIYHRQAETGEIPETHHVDLSGAYNSRFSPDVQATNPLDFPQSITGAIIPISQIVGGAAPTWAVLLMAVTHPEFLNASDDGIILTRDGVAMLEKSLAYWTDIAGAGIVTAGGMSLDSTFGAGPVLIGMPFAFIDKLKTAYQTARDKSGLGGFVLYLMQIAFSFVGFYAGVAGLSGLVGGSFTLPNISGALSTASRLGVDTTKLSFAVKLANLTTDAIPSTISSNSTGMSTGAPAMDDLTTDTTAPDFTAALAEWNATQVDFTSGLDFTDPVFSTPDNIPVDTVIATDNGLSIDNFVVVSPEEAAWYSNNAADPAAQTQALQTVTDRVTQAAASAGIAFSPSDILKYASQALGLAAAWKNIQHPAGAGVMTASGARVLTNPNGTRTVTYPDGRVVTLPATYTSPGVSPSTIIPGISDKVVYIGGAVAIGAVLLLSSRRS